MKPTTPNSYWKKRIFAGQVWVMGMLEKMEE
jgi:hypothetical protein